LLIAWSTLGLGAALGPLATLRLRKAQLSNSNASLVPNEKSF
jgi:hypothetical protein